MSYKFSPEPDEKVITHIAFQPSAKSEPFHFAITDSAFYIPATRFVVAGDPYYLKKIALSNIASVSIEQVKPYGFWFVGILMATAGLALGLLGLNSLSHGLSVDVHIFGWSLALIVGGLLLPRVGKGRLRLVVQHREGKYRWTPPLVVDSASKREVVDIIDRIKSAALQLGIATYDPRAADKSGAETAWRPLPIDVQDPPTDKAA